MENIVRLSRQIDIIPFGERGIIYHSGTRKTFLVGHNEMKIILYLKEKRIVDINEMKSRFIEMEKQDISDIFLYLEKQNFFREISPQNSFFRVHIKLLSLNKMIRKNNAFLSLIYFVIKYFSVPIGIVGVFLLGLSIELYNQYNLISLVCMLLLFSAIHELGHACIAKYYNISTSEFGLMIYWFLPYFYTTICGIELLEKSKRLFVLLSGIMMNFLLFGVFQLISYLWRLPIFATAALVNLVLVVLNFQIFIKLDGYYILCEIIGDYKLREKAFAIINRKKFSFSKKQKKRVFVKKEKDQHYYIEQLFNIIYLVFSVIYIPITIGSIVISVINFWM